MNALTPTRPNWDYQPCRYGAARLAFRGPQKKLRGNHITFLGGTETFGPFIATPYPDLVELQTGLTCVNLACRKGGIDSYLSAPSLIDVCGTGAVTVIEATGAQNMSNRFYSVDPRHNNRFIRASKLMKAIFFDIDFRNIETTEQLLDTIVRDASDRLPLFRQEIQSAWVARMRSLIRAIGGTTVLLWAADHAPYSNATGGTIAREPMFVDRAMLDAVMDDADHLVEVVISKDEVAAGFQTTLSAPEDISIAVGMLGQIAHRRIAATLSQLLMALLEKPEHPPAPEENLFAIAPQAS